MVQNFSIIDNLLDGRIKYNIKYNILQAGLNWKPGMKFKKSQILIYWSIMYKFFLQFLTPWPRIEGLIGQETSVTVAK